MMQVRRSQSRVRALWNTAVNYCFPRLHSEAHTKEKGFVKPWHSMDELYACAEEKNRMETCMHTYNDT